MDFKIGAMADSFKIGVIEGIRSAAAVGAEGVQIYATRGELSPETITDAKIDEVKSVLAENNTVISALCGDFGGHGFMLAEENAERIVKSKRIVDLAKVFGCDIVTTHIGVVPQEENDTKKIMREACIELAEYASSVHSFFAVETGPEPCDVLKDFLDSLKVRGVAVNYDPANLVMVTGDDEVRGVSVLRDYIVHTHAKDGVMLAGMDPKEAYERFAQVGIDRMNAGAKWLELPLGKGAVRFDEYLAALDSIGYHGFLTIEREVGDTPREDIAMASQFLKEKIAK